MSKYLKKINHFFKKQCFLYIKREGVKKGERNIRFAATLHQWPRASLGGNLAASRHAMVQVLRWHCRWRAGA